MLNYLKKFALEILPSVAATVIGAYIVNHYVSRPAVDAPVAASVSPAQVKKNAAKPLDPSTDVANTPEPGVTARGISERAMIEKAAAEKPAEVKPTENKPSEAKPGDLKPTETASASADPRHHATPAAPHEKAMAKADPAPAPASTEEHRDANDLARSALERLRGADNQPKTQEASRVPETPRLQEAPRTVTPPATATAAIRPLPPPITVSGQPVESPAPAGPYTASIQNNDPNRPIPPADIPPPPPIDLRANASELASHTHDMAQHMLSAARSVFHAVLPSTDSQQSSNNTNQFAD